MGKWLSFIVLFTTSAFAQVPLLNPSNVPPIPFSQAPNPEPTPIEEFEIDPTLLGDSWGNCLQADVWVLIDYSGSMASYERFVAEALARIATGIIQENSPRRMGFISFDDSATLKLPLTNSLEQAYSAIKSFSRTPAKGGTEINNGLLSVTANHLISPPNKLSRSSEYKKILILISDGEDSSYDEIISTANKMKSDGWWIYSIMVGKKYHSEPLDQDPYFQLMKYISGNPNDNEEFYVDSILLSDLPEHFSQRFSCM